MPSHQLLLTRRTEESFTRIISSSLYPRDSVFIVLRKPTGTCHFVSKTRPLQKWLSRQAKKNSPSGNGISHCRIAWEAEYQSV